MTKIKSLADYLPDDVFVRSRRGMSCAFVPHPRVQVNFDDAVSMTRQEFAEESDINSIMARYERTGVWPNAPQSPPVYFDATDMPADFREAMDILNAGNTAFMSLPASVRKEFDNDPRLFVDYAADPKNIGRMREWGLAPPEKAPDAPMRVEVVNPPPAPEPAPAGSKGS